MAEFMFVNLNDPTQNKRREVRKLVRSHVSYMQHSQKKTELGQVQKPSKSRYTDRSVNGWAVLDEGRAGQLSQRKANAAHGLDSGLLAQHQSTLPGSDPIRSPRQLYHKELPAATKSQRRPRQTQRQPKGSPTPPTPILGDEVNAKKESPQAVSILPIVKSEVYMTSPGEVIVKQEQEQEDQRNHKWDIVSQHALRSQSLSSSSKFELGWEGVELPSTPLSFFFSNLGDPTDELRNRIEFSKMSMSSLMAFLAHSVELLGQDCDRSHSLPTGTLAKTLLTGSGTHPTALAAILLTAVASIRSHQQEPLRCSAMFSLRGYAISCIQAAMSNPETRYSDSTALAIVSMGNFERYFGSEEAYGVHSQGLACLRTVRGGSIDGIFDSVLSWMGTMRAADVSRGTSVVLERFPIET